MQIKFDGKKNLGFHAAVRTNVDEYFKKNNLGKNANFEMIFKSILFLGAYFLLYGLIISNSFNISQMLLMAILLGMTKAFIGFNVSHDAIHGSYSANETVNKIMSHTFHLLGANPYVWSIMHNKVHHTFTNIPGHDEDLDVAPGLVCLSPDEKPTAIMKYQHFYAFFLYLLTSLSWVLRKDYKKMFQNKIGQTDNSHHPSIEYFNLFFYKLLYYIAFIIVPILVLSISWWQVLIGFVIMHFAEGLVLGLVFQLAHVVELTEFPIPSDEGKIEETWAIHQMVTTADFARSSFFARFFCGGLNFQIEHHLFPQICHVHYPQVSEIVKATANEFQVPYNDNPTFIGALKSHYRSLKKFGNQS